MRRIATCLLIAASLVDGANRLVADGVMLDGVSPYTIGRGGTNIAFADNGSMLYDNPAGMGQMASQGMFQAGITTLWTEFKYADPQNNTLGQHQMYPLGEISYIRRASDELAFGLGMFSPAGFGSITTLEGNAPFTGPQKYKSFGSLNKLLFGASYSPTERLSVGATIGPALSFANLEGPYTLQGPSVVAGLPTLLDMDVHGWALVWSAGLMYRLTETTTIGASYLSQSDVHAHGTTSVVTPLGNSSYDTDANIVWPRSVGIGARQQLGARHVLATDVIWFNWRDAFDNFTLNLTNPSNPGFPSVVERYPLGWHDTVSTRVGYEYHMDNGQIARAGYVHHDGASPSSTLTPYIPAALENAISLGYGLPWKDWSVNASYMYSFGPHEVTGTSAFIGGDFDDSRHYHQTHAAGITLTKLLGCKPDCGSSCGCGDAVR